MGWVACERGSVCRAVRHCPQEEQLLMFQMQMNANMLAEQN